MTNIKETDIGTVTKKDLVARIAKDTGLKINDVQKAVEGMIKEISASLSGGDRVVLRNFGTFEVFNHKKKVGRNPKKPEIEIEIPARRVVRFKVGRELKASVLD